jgi:hypothetical protein
MFSLVRMPTILSFFGQINFWSSILDTELDTDVAPNFYPALRLGGGGGGPRSGAVGEAQRSRYNWRTDNATGNAFSSIGLLADIFRVMPRKERAAFGEMLAHVLGGRVLSDVPTTITVSACVGAVIPELKHALAPLPKQICGMTLTQYKTAIDTGSIGTKKVLAAFHRQLPI